MTKDRAADGGRKPLPTVLKVLRGNLGRRPLNEYEPKPEVRLPRPPSHLSAQARREWRRAGAFLGRGRGRAGAYCVAFAR